MMKSYPDNAYILAFVPDLYFSVKVDRAAQKLGFSIEVIEDPKQLYRSVKGDHPIYKEHLGSTQTILIDYVTRLHPSLLIFDLSSNEIPWREWIAMMKSSPATRRIPIVCFGAHVDISSLSRAKSLGADAVYPRSRFTSQLPNIIIRYSQSFNYEGLLEACDAPLSANGVQGIELFNMGEYYMAHELLEIAWMEDETPGRNLYRSLLQVAVAYYQVEQGNFRGAIKMFLRLRQWIDPLPDHCRGVNVGKVRTDVKAIYQKLVELGPAYNTSLIQQMVNPIEYLG